MPQEICDFITQTMTKGIDAALTKRGILAPLSVLVPSQGATQPLAHMDCESSLGGHSPSPSHHSDQSLMEDEDAFDFNLPGEEEEVSSDRPRSTGLFRHEMFKTLLHKARVTANMGITNLLFTEAVPEHENIPSPKLFVDTVQQQWAQMGSIPTPSGLDKKLYTVDQVLEDLLKLPVVNVPLAHLTSPSILPSDATEGLKTEDKRAEFSIRKTHQAATWAIKSATAASFFARMSLIWLRQMQSRISPDDARLHQDVNKLIAAAEFSVDATLNSAKFASRALASNITSRRLLWLCHWQAGMRTKWQLASVAFKGGSLFGEALDPVLVEGRDKNKVLPSTSQRSDWCSAFPYQRLSFRPLDPRFQSPAYCWSFNNPSDRVLDRQSF